MAGKSKRNNEDNIPEGLDDLLNELTGNKNNTEDNIPEGLDDLLNQIKGKKSTATKPKRKRGRPRKKKTSPPGALTKYSKTEDVDSRILELLGLEYTFDLDYDDYANLLKEKLIEVSRGSEETSTEDAILLREELKKARGNKGKGTFKVKKKISKDSFTNFNVGGPKKDTAQTRKPAYALLKGKDISEKSQRVDDLKENQKEEKKERKQSDNQILKSISKSLDRIIGILSKQLKFDKDQSEKQRKLEERGKRKDKENKRESAFSKGIKSLAKVAGKIFSPLQDFFGKIIRFFTVIFLGKVFQKFLKWFTDPKNESKIKTIGRLLKTFWPAILAGLVFLNPLGRLITKAVFVIGKGVAKLLKVAIPSLLKFGMRNPKVAAALAAAGLFTFGAWGPKVIPGLTNDEEDDDEVKSYKRGGKITTESGQDIRGAGVDTQLIAARPGEIVINKETVNAVGADYFLGLNRQYGGSNANKPKTAKVQAASGGGLILPAFAYGGEVGGEGKEESKLQKPRKQDKNFKDRYISGDRSLLNQVALGNYDEALKILGLKNDNNTGSGQEKPRKQDKNFKDRYISGDRSLLNQVALGNYDEALKILGLKNDNNTGSGQEKPRRRESDSKSNSSSGQGFDSGFFDPEKLKGKAKEKYHGIIRSIYSTFADPLKRSEAEKYVTQEEYDKLSPEQQLDKLVIGSIDKDTGAVLRTKTALTKRMQDKQDATIAAIRKGSNSDNLFERARADIMNRGMIPLPSQILSSLGATKGFDKAISGLSGGRINRASAVISGLEMTAKGLLGDLGKPLRTDASSIIEYNKPLMDFAIENNLVNSKGEFLIGKDSWSEILKEKAYATQDVRLSDEEKEKGFRIVGETKNRQGAYKVIDDKGKEQTRYTEHLYDKMQRESMGSAAASKIANYGLGQFVFSIDPKTGKAMVTDSWDSNNSADYYFGESESAAKNVNPYPAAFKGLSGLLRVNQNSFFGLGNRGFANTLPAGIDIKSQSTFNTDQQIKNNQAYAASKGKYYSSTTGKTYGSYAEALKDPAVAAAAEAEKTKQRKAQQSQRMSMAKLMNNNSAGLYYSSTTGKTYANYAEALKDPQVAAAAEVEKTKQRFSFSPSSKPSQTTTPSKPSQTTTPSKPKRWAMDPRGWFGMEGGGVIKENTGMDIPGGGTDRQRIDVQPGEYVLPVDKVMKMGGPGKLDRMVADLDSNSTPAKMGLRNKDISEGITPYSVQGSGEIDIETLPLSGLGGMGGSSGTLNSPNGTQDEFFSPISSAGLSERQRFMDTIGISAFT